MLPICILSIEDESDREFMTRVYTRYQWLMYDTIKQVIGDHWSAEDVVQNTLIRLINKIEKLKTLDERHMVNYIITACKHTAYNEVRNAFCVAIFLEHLIAPFALCPCVDNFFPFNIADFQT